MEQIKKATSYPKFKGEKVRLILFWFNYLVRECESAFERLGYEIHRISVASGNDYFKGDKFLKELLITLCEFKPDFIFTINHAGFDCEGKLTQILAELRIPCAIWYVDSPTYILENCWRKKCFTLHSYICVGHLLHFRA